MSANASDRPEPSPASDEKVPGWTPEVGTRIALVVEKVGGLKRASDILDVKAETIGKWRDGVSRAPLFSMQTLVNKAGMTLDWLIAGDEAQSTPTTPASGIDIELMGRITDAIARLYKDMGASLAPVDLGRMAAERYSEIAAATADPEEQRAMIKLVVQQLKRDIQAAAAEPGTGKHVA